MNVNAQRKFVYIEVRTGLLTTEKYLMWITNLLDYIARPCILSALHTLTANFPVQALGSCVWHF